MFFKRLEIVGFKSFAAKTTVEFQPGVTVIVGPNGCGKSNVLDSIKWVLGSQSPKSMRGKTMQDVIFAGSASFKALGVAQVTLTLNNSSRTLDLDYDEVQISRRLFRTGESEYFLNKVPCRLRDLHNLFLGTGAGTMSYSVLEQGKVDQIINAKPEERRYIFEEAAGISKYKMRKLEALRKLERTAADLKRLEDLISEVSRQVGSLKRQAGKAERYRELSAELRQAEMELLVLRSAGLRGQLHELQGQIAGLQDRAQALRARYDHQSADEQKRKDEAETIEHTLSERSREHLNTMNRIRELEHLSHRHGDRIAANLRRLDQIASEKQQFEVREGELNQRKADVRQRRDEAANELEEAKKDFQEREASYNQLRGQVDEQTRLIEALSREAGRLREQLSRCENTIRIEESNISRNEDTRRETLAVLERLDSLLAESGMRRAELSSRAEALTTEIEEARANSSSLQIRFAEVHGRIAELTRAHDATSRELHQRQARLSTLEELKANFEGFHQGVREVMKAAARNELAGVVGPVVNLIKSESEHELAIEVALDSRLQDIVVKDTAAARAGLELLSRGGLGRVTFLPLDRVSGADPEAAALLDETLAKEGVIGHAPALTTAKSQIKKLVQALLGRVIVVRDFEAAERLSRECPLFTYVDLAGQMIHATGAITGGNLKSSGLLGREREIGELIVAVAELSAKLESTQARIQEERGEADHLSGEMKGCTSRLHDLEVQRAGVVKEHESVARHHDDSIAQKRQREERIAALQTEIEERTARKATLETERVSSDRELSETTSRWESAREQAREQSETFIQFSQRLTDARARLEKVKERLAHLEESSIALDREALTLESSRAARAEEEARLVQDNTQSETEIAGIRTELEGLFAGRDALEKQLAEERTEREQLILAVKQLVHELEQIQRDERIVENELHERQLRQVELQAALNGLSEQAQEKFNRDLYEIVEELRGLEKDPVVLAQEVAQLREKIDRMGPVNLAALDEYNEQNSRLQFLTAQQTDLVESKAQIEASIAQLDETTKQLFHETFESVRGHFVEMFRRLFNGGKADLVIDQQSGDPLLEGGIEIYAQPPGKKFQTLSLMSGGEKAMTAISLLFGLFLHKPAPFAILDEIDAPLDDANVERFKNVVLEFSRNTQFVIISHNKQTMELADAIYGVTMEESGVSKLVSVRFASAEQEMTSAG